ncbi:hypothetical protein M2164_000109 [Streptomyces sp. SAI-208]|uniref:hypothetical protein n=1 Tax=Streptomyces sp. SAI-208 TaxID=2940550 RepID=UPI002476A60E|nr:hypothetical protein [Streptomyces sp. SAI-208]MDH6604474.1 hypothetical protein [Streptomyces sp. SAI-208]
MEPTLDDPDFWADIMTMRDPAYRAPTEDEVLQLEDDVADAAHALAVAISARESAYRVNGQDVPDAVVASPDWQLTYLYALHMVDGIVKKLADRTARAAGGIGANYGHLGAAWGGITKQAARLRWPGAVRRPTDLTEKAEPFQLSLAGGVAEIVQLPDAAGFAWAATGGDGTIGQGEEPYGSRTEAAAHAGAFLALHGEPDEGDHAAAHADCVQPHPAGDGYVDCDGRPL